MRDTEAVASLLIKRRHSWQNRFRKFHVLLDGMKIGELADGGECQFDLVPGEHTVQVVLSERYKTESIEISISPGKTVFAECGPGGPLPGMKALWRGDFDSDNYIVLRMIEG